jgi:hypothetical protein
MVSPGQNLAFFLLWTLFGHVTGKSASQNFRPLNPINLTLFHVNEANYTTIDNKNTGDAAGDAEFMIRAAGLAYLCGPDSGEAEYTYDCGDVEQTGSNLVVSKIMVQVSNNFSEYAECNVNDTTHEYECVCEDRSSTSHHWHRQVPCNNTVGAIAVVNESGWAHELPNASSKEPWETSAYRYYFFNSAQKFGGNWFSTLATGDCTTATQQDNCTWQTIQTVRRISKKCQDDKLFSLVERVGDPCFSRCGSDAHNKSTACWTTCFYDTVFGPNSNRTAFPAVLDGSTGYGMNKSTLVNAWLSAFSAVSEGGCPEYKI